MLYVNSKDNSLRNNDNAGGNDDDVTQSQFQWILLSENKPFMLTAEEVAFVNNALATWGTMITLNPYIINKAYLTKIIRGDRYNLRNRKTIKRNPKITYGAQNNNKRNDSESLSNRSASAVLTKQKRKRDTRSHKKKTKDNKENDSKEEKDEDFEAAVNDDDDDFKDNKGKKKVSKSHKKKLRKGCDDDNIPKDIYQKRLNRMMAKLGNESNNNNPSENEYVTAEQVSLFFGEMMKTLSRKQDKKQRRSIKEIKEEEHQEKVQKISSFKQRIYQLNLSQINELNNEFFKAENDTSNNINLDFEKLTHEQIDMFSLKLEMFEKLNLLNKDNHKTYKDELAEMRMNKLNKDLSSIKPNVKISGKDIPFIDEDDDEDSLSESSDEDEGQKEKEKKDSEISIDEDSDDVKENIHEIRGNADNVEKTNNYVVTHKKIIDDDDDISEDSDDD